MQGESRPGAKSVAITLNIKLLEAFDAVVAPRQRSRAIEALMREHIMRRKLGGQVPPEA
jgi:metal-responsive CopG/Arc/MetJ family transcriptional regulator